VHSEKLGELAEQFDRVHSVHRALEVGALHCILPPANLRPYLIHAVESGMAKWSESAAIAPKNVHAAPPTLVS
jgi:hypothetical protein